ncbi:hypothetical protein ES703_119755 [subsurface metagenome]
MRLLTHDSPTINEFLLHPLKGVNHPATDIYLPVQVRTGSHTGGTHLTDDITPFYNLPYLHQYLGEMMILGVHPSPVVNDDASPLQGELLSKRHHAVATSQDGCAFRCSDVYPQMPSH